MIAFIYGLSLLLLLLNGHKGADQNGEASLQEYKEPSSTMSTLKLSQTDTYTFEVDHNGVKCIKAHFHASIFITYVATLDNRKSSPEETEVLLPASVEMSGGCDASNTFLLLSWHHSNYSIKLTFDRQSKNWRGAGEDKSYHQTPGYSVSKVDITVDTRNTVDFQHPHSPGVHVMSLPVNKTIFWAPAQHSYKCDSKSFFTLHEYLNGKRNDSAIHSLRLEMWEVQLQAFDDVQEDIFSTAIVCESDTLNTLPKRNAVPVIVAACLAGVIIIIVLAYVINNRISSSSYKPMPD